MTEYIVDFGDSTSSAFVGLAMAEAASHGAKMREEIVRCRDCTYYDGEPDLESSMPKCWRDPEHRGTATWTRPDGFCALAKRREP